MLKEKLTCPGTSLNHSENTGDLVILATFWATLWTHAASQCHPADDQKRLAGRKAPIE